MEVVAATGSEAYVALMRRVLNDGEPIAPRGQQTFELTDVTVHVEDLAEAHVFHTVRKVNRKIAATEYMHLLGGVSSLEQLDLASGGRFSQFADNGRLMGAYGPRIRHQLPRVVDLLHRDPDTRQAVLTIWRGHEHHETSKDVPCTLTLQFLRRNGRLNLRVSMRSNDVVLGIPYDWFMFSRLGLSVANALGVEPGTYTHTVGSMHLYDRDMGIANDVEEAGVVSKPGVVVPPALTHIEGRKLSTHYPISWVTDAAEAIVLGRDTDTLGFDFIGADWYLDHVPRLTNSQKCNGCHCVVPTRLDTGLCARCE
jgi:thymidylate synthase